MHQKQLQPACRGGSNVLAIGIVPGVCTGPQAAFFRQPQCLVCACASAPGSKGAPGEGQGVEWLLFYAWPDTGLGRASRRMKAE